MAYATVAQLKLYRGIGVTEEGDDALLTDLLDAAQAQVDHYCDRTFEASTESTRHFDAVRDVSPDRRTLYLGTDLAEVTTITNGTGTVVTKYVTEPVNDGPYHAIRLKQTAGELFTYTTEPESAITVRGKWAYSTAAPADIMLATIRLAAYLYAQKDSGVFDVTLFPDQGAMTVPQGMPRDVKIILEPYKRVR